MPLNGLTHVTLGVPDPFKVGEYFEEFGLEKVGEGRYATVTGGEQLRLTSAPRRIAVEIGMSVDDPDDLDRIGRSLEALGVTVENGQDRLAAKDSGTGVKVVITYTSKPKGDVHDLRVDSDDHVRVNSRAQCLERTQTDLRPLKLGHVVLGSTDREASDRFFTSGLGMKVSDQLKDKATFLRCSTDHHNVLVSSAPVKYLHHTSWQVSDLDAVGQAARNMLDGDESRHVWGLGRHYLGSNFFWYLRDPAGNFTEYYADMDQITDDDLWVPGVWEGSKSHYSWGPTPPDEIFDPEDLVAAMMGAH
jgi:catechol-2,3-dioxygenase